jgi:hypothetical protein
VATRICIATSGRHQTGQATARSLPSSRGTASPDSGPNTPAMGLMRAAARRPFPEGSTSRVVRAVYFAIVCA